MRKKEEKGKERGTQWVGGVIFFPCSSPLPHPMTRNTETPSPLISFISLPDRDAARAEKLQTLTPRGDQRDGTRVAEGVQGAVMDDGLPFPGGKDLECRVNTGGR